MEDSVTLVVGDAHKFLASKEKLCSSSPYFQAMFHGGFAEERTSLVKIEGVTKIALEALLNDVDGLEMSLTSENVFQILQAAGMLQFVDAQRKCCNFIASILSLDNVAQVLREADFLCEEKLFNQAFRLVLYKFPQFRESKGFLELSCRLVTLLLSHNNLNAKSEFHVFEAAKSWLKHDYDSRGHLARQLFGCVRFSELSVEEKEVSIAEFTFDKSIVAKRRSVPQFPCCIGRYKKSPCVFLFDPDAVKVEPFLSLTE